eukprot:GHVH01009853.1.p1 GENE.GHVH01009853.1~~GHVH01009853.1.p1  ORF type:complete len:317 (-),score=64.90 GHVH01009853.1:156-1106(-)
MRVFTQRGYTFGDRTKYGIETRDEFNNLQRRFEPILAKAVEESIRIEQKMDKLLRKRERKRERKELERKELERKLEQKLEQKLEKLDKPPVTGAKVSHALKCRLAAILHWWFTEKEKDENSSSAKFFDFQWFLCIVQLDLQVGNEMDISKILEPLLMYITIYRCREKDSGLGHIVFDDKGHIVFDDKEVKMMEGMTELCRKSSSQYYLTTHDWYQYLKVNNLPADHDDWYRHLKVNNLELQRSGNDSGSKEIEGRKKAIIVYEQKKKAEEKARQEEDEARKEARQKEISKGISMTKEEISSAKKAKKAEKISCCIS